MSGGRTWDRKTLMGKCLVQYVKTMVYNLIISLKTGRYAWMNCKVLAPVEALKH